MPTTITINKELVGIDKAPPRGKGWAKVVTSVNDVDLSKPGGYALTTAFVRWGSNVVMPDDHGSSYPTLIVSVNDKVHSFDNYGTERSYRNGNAFFPQANRDHADNHPLYAAAMRALYWAHDGSGDEDTSAFCARQPAPNLGFEARAASLSISRKAAKEKIEAAAAARPDGGDISPPDPVDIIENLIDGTDLTEEQVIIGIDALVSGDGTPHVVAHGVKLLEVLGWAALGYLKAKHQTDGKEGAFTASYRDIEKALGTDV